jgi:hypothetical protein
MQQEKINPRVTKWLKVSKKNYHFNCFLYDLSLVPVFWGKVHNPQLNYVPFGLLIESLDVF